jgi:hypothetical protein
MSSREEYPNKPAECHHLDCEKEKLGFMHSGDRICNGCGMVFTKMAKLQEAQADALRRLGQPRSEG